MGWSMNVRGRCACCAVEWGVLACMATALDTTQCSRTNAGRIPYIEFLVLHSIYDHTCAPIGLIVIEPILTILVEHVCCVDGGADQQIHSPQLGYPTAPNASEIANIANQQSPNRSHIPEEGAASNRSGLVGANTVPFSQEATRGLGVWLYS